MPNDAYPCITTDVTGPGGLSVYAEIDDMSNYAINSSSLGDFFINLWISTENDEENIVKAPGLVSSRIEEINTKTGVSVSIKEASLSQQSVLVNNISKGFVGYNLYLNNEQVNSQPVTENEHLFENLPNGEYIAGVQSVYTSDSSKVVNKNFSIYFVDVDVNTNSKFKAFPNPFSSEIKFSNLSEVESISIYNIIGVEIIRKQVKGNLEVVMSTQNMPKGIYIVNINLSNGERFVQRMIKE
jgi:hypothetical protein